MPEGGFFIAIIDSGSDPGSAKNRDRRSAEPARNRDPAPHRDLPPAEPENRQGRRTNRDQTKRDHWN